MASEKSSHKLVVLGVGGTIAGMANYAGDDLNYLSGQVSVDSLLKAVKRETLPVAGCAWVTEQVAQLDSKDMDFGVWRQLALRVSHHLGQADVKGIVITHGTDTLEETAYFLHAVVPSALCSTKPVVLTCAMRPFGSIAPDGPQNLFDAMALATTAGACGVLVVCAGTIHRALDVQKVHPYRLDAFSSGDAGPLGFIENGTVRLNSNWPLPLVNRALNAIENIASVVDWPRVEIVMNHAGASGAIVDALLAQSSQIQLMHAPLRGLVVAGTGNGTVHHALEAALIRAQAAGVTVWRATRCANGRVLPTEGNPIPDSQGLTPVKARVALMLSLMA